MQRLGVCGSVRPIYGSLGVKRLSLQVKFRVFSHATLCLFVYNIGRFEEFHCLHLQGEAEGATALFVKYFPGLKQYH